MKEFLYHVATDQTHGFGATCIKIILWGLSWIYRLLVILRRICYTIGIFRSHKLVSPVISIGNLTVGGAGKTPLVALIALALKERNSQPAVLMRGYMGGRKNSSGNSSDEAMMLQAMLGDTPILVGADRVKRAKVFLEERKTDIFLLDDGFQHWRLSRDLDIVVIDATNPWGNGHLLPRGILREAKGALIRAHIIVLTKVDLRSASIVPLKDELQKINTKALIVEATHKPISLLDIRLKSSVDLTSIKGQKVATVCSIGSPDSFAQTITQLGADGAKQFAFMDHHCYTQEDVERIIESCQEQSIDTIVTTQKDAVKLRLFGAIVPEHIRILSLEITIDIVQGKDAFFERIHHLL